jgi:hypothetical protein
MIIAFIATSMRAEEDSVIEGSSQMRAAILIFKDQKCQYLAMQRDSHLSNARKLRSEVRDQIAAVKASTVGPMRREVRESIEDAKRHASEQARKLVQETAEAAKDSRRGL